MLKMCTLTCIQGVRKIYASTFKLIIILLCFAIVFRVIKLKPFLMVFKTIYNMNTVSMFVN